MSKKLVFWLSCCVCLLICGCTTKEQNELNVLNWSSYIPDAVLRDFSKEYGIKLNYGTYSSNEECLAKIQSAKKGTFDLIFPSDYMVELMRKRNLIQPLDQSQLTNLGNLNPHYLKREYDPNNEYSLPFLAATTVLAVNTERISDSITSYQDLLNPKYRNDIVILDDQRMVIGMALQALGYSMNETSPTKLAEAKAWLLKLKPNIKAFDSDSPKTFLISKEASIGVLWNAEAALAMKENPRIKIIYPAEGMAISMDNFAIPVNAKNKANAYLFIDYILRADVMQKIIEAYPYKTVNQASESKLSDEYLKNTAANVPDAILDQASFVKNIGNSIRDYDKLWAEIK